MTAPHLQIEAIRSAMSDLLLGQSEPVEATIMLPRSGTAERVQVRAFSHLNCVLSSHEIRVTKCVGF